MNTCKVTEQSNCPSEILSRSQIVVQTTSRVKVPLDVTVSILLPKQNPITKEDPLTAKLEVSKSTENDHDYKSCSNCGQGYFPHRYCVCFICGNQVGSIKYLRDPVEYLQSCHFNVETKQEKHDTAVEETFAGLDEMEVSKL